MDDVAIDINTHSGIVLSPLLPEQALARAPWAFPPIGHLTVLLMAPEQTSLKDQWILKMSGIVMLMSQWILKILVMVMLASDLPSRRTTAWTRWRST